VYDAIRILEAQGLAEIPHIRAHSTRGPTEEATETLRDQYEERSNGCTTPSIRVDVVDDGDEEPVQKIWAMTGRDAIENRTDPPIEKATNEMCSSSATHHLLTGSVETLNEADEHGLLNADRTTPRPRGAEWEPTFARWSG